MADYFGQWYALLKQVEEELMAWPYAFLGGGGGGGEGGDRGSKNYVNQAYYKGMSKQFGDSPPPPSRRT